jgi:hypothetical protein
MIQQITCYVPVCDVCGKSVDDEAEIICHYDTEAEALERAFASDEYGGVDCKEIDGKLCCSKCWTYGDEDDPEIRA